MSIPDLSRRSLLHGGLLALAGAVSGFAVARNSGAAQAATSGTAANAYGGAPPSGADVLVALGDVPAGGGVVVRKAGVVVTRSAGGDVHAFSATCTHQGCTVSGVSGGTINCPCHGSRFDAATGRVVQGPATKALPRIDVRVSGNDVVAG
jgi:Rieske Fe-S protein